MVPDGTQIALLKSKELILPLSPRLQKAYACKNRVFVALLTSRIVHPK
jgi:hypothetical protein